MEVDNGYESKIISMQWHKSLFVACCFAKQFAPGSKTSAALPSAPQSQFYLNSLCVSMFV